MGHHGITVVTNDGTQALVAALSRSVVRADSPLQRRRHGGRVAMAWIGAVRCVTLVLYITPVIASVRVQHTEALSGGSSAPQSPTGQRRKVARS